MELSRPTIPERLCVRKVIFCLVKQFGCFNVSEVFCWVVRVEDPPELCSTITLNEFIVFRYFKEYFHVSACLDLNKTVFSLEKIFCFHTAAKIQIISLFDETRETLITEQLTDTTLILRHETSLINFHTSSCVICDQTLTWFDLFSLLLSASLCSVITGASAALNYKHSLNKTCVVHVFRKLRYDRWLWEYYRWNTLEMKWTSLQTFCRVVQTALTTCSCL